MEHSCCNRTASSHLNVARLRAHVVDVRPLEPGDDEMHPLSHNAFLYPGQPVEDDRAVTTVHCDKTVNTADPQFVRKGETVGKKM